MRSPGVFAMALAVIMASTLSSVVAQTVSITILWMGDSNTAPCVANVVNVDGSATTYAITSDLDGEENVVYTMTYGPSVYDYAAGEDGTIYSEHCITTGTTEATCTTSAWSSGATEITIRTMTRAFRMHPILLTAGLEKLVSNTQAVIVASETSSAKISDKPTGAVSEPLTRQTSITTIVYPALKTEFEYGSVVASRSSIVTYYLPNPCPTSEFCAPERPGLNATFGSTFYEFQQSGAGQLMWSERCDYQVTDKATCTQAAIDIDSSSSSMLVTEISTLTTDGMVHFLTITAGLEKLEASTTSSNTSPTTGSNTPSMTASKTSSTKPNVTAVTGTKTESAPVTTSSSGASGDQAVIGLSAAGVFGVALAALML